MRKARTKVLFGAIAAALSIVAAYGSLYNVFPQSAFGAEHEGHRVLELLGMPPCATVADVGAGDGKLALVLARRAKRVFATEAGTKATSKLRASLEGTQVRNVTVIEGRRDATNLPEACCGGVFLRRVYHHLEDPLAINSDLFKGLQPGGLLVVSDFSPRPWSRPPAGVNAGRSGHGVRRATVIEEIEAAGFESRLMIGRWTRRDYLIVFQKPAADQSIPAEPLRWPCEGRFRGAL